MLVCDRELKRLLTDKVIGIEPLDERCIRPGSICLRLGSIYLIPKTNGPIDIRDKKTYPQFSHVNSNPKKQIIVKPKSLILAHTQESISLPRTYGAWISNLSGLGRLGISVVFSNFVSPGFGERGYSTLTLEIYNSLNVPIKLHAGMRICHLIIIKLTSKSDESYDIQVGTYSKQKGPRPSMFYDDFTLINE